VTLVKIRLGWRLELKPVYPPESVLGIPLEGPVVLAQWPDFAIDLSGADEWFRLDHAESNGCRRLSDNSGWNLVRCTAPDRSVN
jgi:hypothetical protein